MIKNIGQFGSEYEPKIAYKAMNATDFEPMSHTDRVICSMSIIIMSSIGVLTNGVFLRYLFTRSFWVNSFLVLCFSKAMSNLFVCCINLFWIGPATLSEVHYLPPFFNSLLGQLNEYGFYAVGPCIQLLMAIERFLIIFYPLEISEYTRTRYVQRGIIISWVICLGAVVVTYPINCWVIYSIQEVDYGSENDECDEFLMMVLLIQSVLFACISTALELATFVKLFLMQSLQNMKTNSHRKKSIRLFVQSVLQDLLHTLDLINSRNLFNVSSVVGRFYVFTFSLILIHALDGLIMCIFHIRIRFRYGCSNIIRVEATTTS